MPQFTIFDSTGRVAHRLSVPDEEVMLYETDDTILVAGDFPGGTHYVLSGEVTERPASPVSRTDLTLLDVPVGSTLWINGVSYPAEGTVDLEFPLPGTFQLRVECFPFLDWNDEVTVP